MGVFTNVSCHRNETTFNECQKKFKPGTSCDFDENSVNKLASVICYADSLERPHSGTLVDDVCVYAFVRACVSV